MIRYFNKNSNTYNNYTDEIDTSYMFEIPDDGKPYGIINAEIVDISDADEYKQQILEKEITIKKNTLQYQIDEIDKKRIRAIAEPALKDESQTWLEYYTEQIQELRRQIAEL